mmetsp:Transcript_35029/g.62608  ORF Transcript_35029/g.62608 Transcript_35029/m.62608 type:complete len:226 (+) Transcript_35029:427-1104(+)
MSCTAARVRRPCFSSIRLTSWDEGSARPNARMSIGRCSSSMAPARRVSRKSNATCRSLRLRLAIWCRLWAEICIDTSTLRRRRSWLVPWWRLKGAKWVFLRRCGAFVAATCPSGELDGAGACRSRVVGPAPCTVAAAFAASASAATAWSATSALRRRKAGDSTRGAAGASDTSHPEADAGEPSGPSVDAPVRREWATDRVARDLPSSSDSMRGSWEPATVVTPME